MVPDPGTKFLLDTKGTAAFTPKALNSSVFVFDGPHILGTTFAFRGAPIWVGLPNG